MAPIKDGALDRLATRETFLNPGDIACGFHQEVFGTLLGSCVAITLWHPRRRFGCICHFVLAAVPPSGGADGRYGTSAFALMQRDLVRHGVQRRECIAKIFGGGRMFNTGSMVQDVGARNIDMARRLLADAGMVAAAENVGGNGYRRLFFDVASGDVWLKFDGVGTDQDDVLL